ncbi:MAG: hypothetical protein H6610_10750 [Ignavibacteriales bacterium]|nr:hypothetical protein [Ignavibacteriales bacterium]
MNLTNNKIELLARRLLGGSFPNISINDEYSQAIKNPQKNKIDHSITIIMIVFVIVLFSSIQFFAASALNGNYTINTSGGDYTTIAAAVSDLYANGISGPVTFTIEGTFNEQIDLDGAISGSSKFNPIIFMGGKVTYTATTSADNFVVRINSANYIEFINNIFTAGGTTYARIIYSEAPNGNITFDGNIFQGTSTSGSDINKALIYFKADNSLENLNSYEFINNTLNDGTYGLYLESFDSPRSTGLRITTNTFNTAYRAIHIDKFDAPKISSNIITNNISSDYSIYLRDCSEDFQIQKNKISTSYSAGSGIRILDCLIGSGRSLIANNFIQACDEGISLNNVSDVDIYFNSVNIEISSDLPLPASAAMDLHESCRDVNIVNNIFNNRREGYALNANLSNGTLQVSSSDYNCFLTTNYLNLIKWNGTLYSSLSISNYQTITGFDLNSIVTHPHYTSITDLHTNEPLLHKAGIQIAAITTDIDNELRISATPCIGADEFLLPLSGTYTIGSNSDYSTIANAVFDLYVSGIDGAVIFKLKDGQYNEQINLDGAITGSSSTNTVTFESYSGFHGNVNITYSANSSVNNYVLRINEAEHLNFRNLTFTAGGSDYAKVVTLENVNGNLEFYDNVMNGFVITSVGTDEQNVISCNNNSKLDNSSFKKNDLNGGNNGIYLSLSSSQPYTTNLQIIENNISTYRQSIRINYADAPMIKSNFLENESTSNIFLNFIINNYIVENNIILGGYGIHLIQCYGTASFNGKIQNNLISVSHTGIDISASSFINVYSNTVRNTRASGLLFTPVRIQNVGTINNIKFINNILYASGGCAAINWEGGTISECNYNNLYTTGPTLVKHGNTDYSTLSDWQSAPEGFDQNSYSSAVGFVSETDLHIQNSSELLLGTNLPEVPEDIDGDTRNDPPFIGADEPILDISELSLKIFLEGPYNTLNGKMNATLTIPTTSPYTENNKTVGSIPNGVVDWVLVKLLDDQFNLVVAQSAFLANNGTIISTNGSGTLKFLVDTASDYYVVVEHRNHLPIMSVNPISIQ